MLTYWAGVLCFLHGLKGLNILGSSYLRDVSDYDAPPVEAPHLDPFPWDVYLEWKSNLYTSRSAVKTD